MLPMKVYEKYHKECKQILKVCKRLYKKNMLAAADGNISLRVNDGVLITPSGVSKAFCEVEDIGLISLSNEILSGDPSSERLMHLAVYNQLPQARAVVHAHPPTAIAWSVAFPEDKELPNNCLSEVVLAAGHIPIVDYARPGTQDMGDVLKPLLAEHKIMILSRHGGLCWGETIEEATLGMERLEHSAEILYKAKTLNDLSFISDQEMQALYELRKKIGNKTL